MMLEIKLKKRYPHIPIEDVTQIFNEGYLKGYENGLKTAIPVRHGHYIGEADGYADGELVYDIWSCSECGCYFEDWDEQPTYNFCPNCGAKMDGERRENAE